MGENVTEVEGGIVPPPGHQCPSPTSPATCPTSPTYAGSYGDAAEGSHGDAEFSCEASPTKSKSTPTELPEDVQRKMMASRGVAGSDISPEELEVPTDLDMVGASDSAEYVKEMPSDMSPKEMPLPTSPAGGKESDTEAEESDTEVDESPPETQVPVHGGPDDDVRPPGHGHADDDAHANAVPVPGDPVPGGPNAQWGYMYHDPALQLLLGASQTQASQDAGSQPPGHGPEQRADSDHGGGGGDDDVMSEISGGGGDDDVMSEISPNTPTPGPPPAAEPAVLHPQPAELPAAAGPPEVLAPPPAGPPAAEPAVLHPQPAEPPAAGLVGSMEIANSAAVPDEHERKILGFLAGIPAKPPPQPPPLPPLQHQANSLRLQSCVKVKARLAPAQGAPVAKVKACMAPAMVQPKVAKVRACMAPAMVQPKVAPPPVSKAKASMAPKAPASSSKSSAIAGPARGSVDWKAHDAAQRAALGLGSAAARRQRKMASAEGAAKLKAKMRDRDERRKRQREAQKAAEKKTSSSSLLVVDLPQPELPRCPRRIRIRIRIWIRIRIRIRIRIVGCGYATT